MSDNTKTPYVPESYTSLSGVGVQQKLYTRAEVDAEIAAALAELLAAHQYQQYHLRAGCSCGWGTTLCSDEEGLKRWRAHILSLAPSPVIAELRTEHARCEKG